MPTILYNLCLLIYSISQIPQIPIFQVLIKIQQSDQNMPKKKVGNYAYDKDEILGQGQYGKVYLAQQIATKTKVAVKIILKQKINEDQYTKNALLREIQIMKTLKSPNIIRFLEFQQSKNNIYIFQELASGGNLRELISQEKRIPQERAIFYMTQIVLGFGEIVRHGIIHRDLKPANILIENNVVKVADFGFARYSENMSFMNSIVGSPIYMSPQVLNRNQYTHYSYKCDIWSFGVLSYEILVGTVPWKGQFKSHDELYQKIKKQCQNGIRFPQDLAINEDIKDLIRGCLKYQEKQRYDWTQIFMHPAFKGALKNSQNQIGQQFSIQQVFALTRLRMSVHAQNIHLDNFFKDFAEELDFKNFFMALKIMDSYIDEQQAYSIFKSISKDKEFIITKDLLHHFEKHGIRLEGMKFSNLIKNESPNSEQLDISIDFVIKTMEDKNIKIEELFVKYDKDKRGYLELEQFSEMIQSINPKLTNQQVDEIFNVFDIEKKNAVTQSVCASKLCKLAMKPNIKGAQFRQIKKEQ